MSAITGIGILLNVNTGTEELPVWTPVGGQRNATLNLESDGIDATSKDNMGWRDEIVGNNSWSLDFDALYLEDDAAYAELETSYMNRKLIKVQLAMPSGKKYEGMARLTLSIEGPYEAEATISGTCTGCGALTITEAGA